MPDPLVTATMDSWTPAAGTGRPQSSAAPTVSDRYAQIDAGGTLRTAVQTARTTGGALILMAKNITTTGKTWWTLRSSGGTAVVRLQTVSGTQSQVQYWDGGAWQVVGASFNTLITSWVNWRVDFTALGTGAGSISWIAETDGTGVPVGSGTTGVINLASIADIAQIEGDFPAPDGGFHYLGPCAIQDTTVAAAYAYCTAPSANGGDSTGATGNFGEIDDFNTAAYDGDLISLAATGDRKSVKNGVDRDYDGRTIAGVGFAYRASCGATGPTSARPYLKIGGTRYYAATQALTTTKLNYFAWWALDPSTGIAW
jgi:hypothetical protein